MYVIFQIQIVYWQEIKQWDIIKLDKLQICRATSSQRLLRSTVFGANQYPGKPTTICSSFILSFFFLNSIYSNEYLAAHYYYSSLQVMMTQCNEEGYLDPATGSIALESLDENIGMLSFC